MEEKPTKTLSGTISDVAFKSDRNDKEYAEVSIMEPGKQYATKCRAFDEAVVGRFHNAKKGTFIGVVITESPGTYEGRAITYRNIVRITAGEKREAFPEQTTALQTAQAGQVRTKAPPDTQAERERATNRRTALMQAVAYCHSAEDVLAVASEFDLWLNREHAPTGPLSHADANEEPPPEVNTTEPEDSPF